MPSDWKRWPPEAKARFLWRLEARPDQLTPSGDWYVWLILSGRGWGKTRTGAEDVAYYGMTHAGVRVAVIGPTAADARDTCVEGESGLLHCLPPECVQTWNRSLGELVLVNGTRYKLFSADEPERLRGPQHHRAWCDELASWRYPETFDMLQFGLRLGDDPRIVVTTTPRPIKIIKDLLAASTTCVTRGRTRDNAENLAPTALAQLELRYAGTRLGRQELEGAVLDDMPGALWQRDRLDSLRVWEPAPMRRVVVAVDPSGGDGPENDEQGIVVCGIGQDNHGYMLDDRTCKLSPEGWARVAVTAYHDHQANYIVAETNFGGAMVAQVIKSVDPSVPVRVVTASRGKAARAEPIASLDAQGRIHQVGSWPEMEDELCSWDPLGNGRSPNRLDARVWAFLELMVTGKEPNARLIDAAPRQAERVHAMQGRDSAWR